MKFLLVISSLYVMWFNSNTIFLLLEKKVSHNSSIIKKEVANGWKSEKTRGLCKWQPLTMAQQSDGFGCLFFKMLHVL